MKKITLTSEIDELKTSQYFNDTLKKLNPKIALKLNKIIYHITGENLISSEKYPTSGFYLSSYTKVNEMIDLIYEFEHGIITCEMNKYENIPDTYKLTFKEEYAEKKSLYNKKFTLDLKSNLNLKTAISYHGKINLNEKINDEYSPWAIIYLQYEITPTQKNSFAIYTGFNKYKKIEILHNNDFYEKFKTYLILLSKTNENILNQNRINLIKNSKKFEQALASFTDIYKNNYSLLEKELEVFQMLTI